MTPFVCGYNNNNTVQNITILNGANFIFIFIYFLFFKVKAVAIASRHEGIISKLSKVTLQNYLPGQQFAQGGGGKLQSSIAEAQHQVLIKIDILCCRSGSISIQIILGEIFTEKVLSKCLLKALLTFKI